LQSIQLIHLLTRMVRTKPSFTPATNYEPSHTRRSPLWGAEIRSFQEKSLKNGQFLVERVDVRAAKTAFLFDWSALGIDGSAFLIDCRAFRID